MATSEETRRLRELHEEYAWYVNAAVGEGREDLIVKLSDEYLTSAMEIMVDERDRETFMAMLPRSQPAGRRRNHAPGWLRRLLHG